MNAENPADMIEVSRVIFAEMTKRTSAGWSGTSMSDALAYGDALHDAGLLADPADRDVKARLIAHRNVLRRMDRAEAEVAELEHRLAQIEMALSDAMSAEVADLRATVERVAMLRDRWARMAGEAMDADTRKWLDAASKSLRAALDGSGQQ